MKQSRKHTLVLLLLALISSASFASTKCEQWNDTEAMIKAMEWQEQHPIYALAPTDWTNGVYYVGVTEAYKATKDQMYLAALKNMGYQNQWKPLYRTHHADDITISYSYLFVSTTRKGLVDLEPTKGWLQEHLFEKNEWNDGNRKPTLWWWCDALFMAPPVLAYYSKLTGEEKYLEAMHKYYTETYDLLYDEDEKLFARDLRYVWKGTKKDIKEENGSKVFWSRGNGWVTGGLALVLQHLPSDYEHRGFYEDLLKEMASKLKAIQDKDGLWRTSLLSPESYKSGEVSGSGLFTYAIAWGINNGILDKKEYEPMVTKAWEALRKCQNNEGMVGYVQNIGDSPKPADATSWQNFGTGAFLLAGSEMLKLQETK